MIGKVQSGELVNGSGNVGNAYSYFTRATGQGLEKADKQEQLSSRFPGLTGKTNTSDQVKLSHEALFGSLSGDNGIKHQESHFNLECFRSNLGLTPPDTGKAEKKEGEEGKSLWEKLEMLSMKTAGQGW